MSQTANTSARANRLQQACLLVGRFQYHFARIEQKIDRGVIKLLDLDDKAGPIVTAVAYEQATDYKTRRFVDRTCKDVFAVNIDRQRVIHSSFEPAPTGGVQFKRTIPREGRVRVDDQVWDDKKFDDQYTKMKKLDDDLHKLVDVIKPAPVEGVITWLSAISEPVRISRPETPGMRETSQFSFIPGSKKADR